MSCKSVGVSWSLLGSIFHNNSGHQLHRHLGDIHIWKSVAELCWVKCPPLEEESQSVFGTPLPPEYHILATRSLRNNPECICLPVFNRTIRFQDNETVHVMCNTQSRKWGKESAGNSDPQKKDSWPLHCSCFLPPAGGPHSPYCEDFTSSSKKISISHIQKQPPSSYLGGRNLSDSS